MLKTPSAIATQVTLDYCAREQLGSPLDCVDLKGDFEDDILVL